MQPLLVITNCPDHDVAMRIAANLVRARLAACVNALSPCTSIYHWQGEIETAQEVTLLIKTREDLYARVQEAIRSEHPYELPEIVAVPVVLGLPGYLDWIAAETAAPATPST
jgi:periplasmic divalent cation tolerance protein